MTPILPRLVRAGLPALIVSLSLFTRTTSAHPSGAEIAATWTGLEYNAHAGGTRLFTLELALDRPAPNDAATLAQLSDRLSGTWTSQPLARDRKGRTPAPQVERVAAEYFGDAGILRVTRRPQQGGAGFDVLVVFDSEVQRLAGVFTGGRREATPFSAVRGASLSAELLGATGLGPGQVVGAAVGGTGAAAPADDWRAAFTTAMAAGDYTRARAIVERAGLAPRTAPETRADPAAGGRDLEAEFMALQSKVQQAAARGDAAEIKRLQEQARSVRAEMAARRAGNAGPGQSPSRPRASPGTGCPEHLVAWAAQLDTYGGSVAAFEGNNHLANLFRPRFFTPFFGKPFAALSAQERAKIAGDLQSRCVMDGTPLGQGSAIGAMIGVFHDTPGFGIAQAGLGGVALEVIADWNMRSVRDLGAEPDAARVSDFETKSTQLIAPLFQRERDDTRVQLAALKSRNHGRRLVAEIDSLRRAALAGSAEAVERLLGLSAHADAAGLAASDRAPFDQAHAGALTVVVPAFLARARAEALEFTPGLEQLLRSKAWLATDGRALQALEPRPEEAAFRRDLLAARAASYAAEKSRMAREIAALDSREALERYPAACVVYTDGESAPAWREVDTQRRARIREFERREFLVRTGDGPFGPEYPGARYLNALWRNDQVQIEELDRRYREPLLAQLAMLESVDYTPDLAERLTGEAGSADRQRRLRRALLEEASLANVLLVAFAFGFEDMYPACMDAEPVEFRVHVQRERMVRNVMGHAMYSVPDGTSTIIHRVNQRHAPAVADLRIADPNDRVLGEALFGRIDREASYVQVGTGLAQAMRDHACDSEVIRRIEAGLLARWETYAARKQAIRARILGPERG